MRRAVASLVIMLLFLGLFAFFFTIQPARAQSGGTITINPDGGISSPVPANITTSDNVTYTFTGDDYLPIIVNRSNVIINGMGHTLQAQGQNGFSLSSASNVTIKNTTITNSYTGIYLYSSSGNILSGNNVTANSGDGIFLGYSCDDNTLSGNNVTANAIGIDLFSGSGNVLSGNNVTANYADGIDLVYSSRNVLSGNMMASNTRSNFGVFTSVLSDCINNVSTSNLVDGKPMCYLINQSNIVISPPTYPKGVGYLGLVNCKNVTVQGLTLTKNGQGMLLANTTNSRITHSSVTANDNDGILLLYSSSNNTLSGNNVTANSGDGVLLGYSCDNNTLSGDHIGANSQYGIEIDSSSGNVLSSNNVTANGDGMSLYSSFGDVFVGNNITNNSNYGVYLGSSSNCTVSGNNITNNIVGVGLGGSSNCTVSKNVFASDGLLVFGSFNNTVVDNSVNGKPLVYLEGASDRHVSGAGQVVLVSCDDITVSNSNLSNAYIGTELWQTNGTIITNNKITNNYPGVLFCYSSNCTVSGNNITNNSNDGIDLEYSSNCTVLGSDITNNSGDGVYLYYSSYCVVSGSSMSNNGYNGVGLWSSSNCTISGNNIVDDMYSGVFLAVSSGNRFFHNNFVNNTQQVYSDGSPNIWDDGYPSGGNYWSNYRTAYPGAIENDSSAIWNKPYVIDTNNSDTYPLMGPFHTFSMGIWNGIAYSIDTVSNSTLSNFTFNPGAKTLTFNVTGTYSPLGFCRIRIPSSFMNCSNPDDWTVKVNGKLNGARNVIPSENCTYIYFTYPLGTEMVQITSTSAATPELQPFMLPPLFMMITLLGAMIFKRKRNAKK